MIKKFTFFKKIKMPVVKGLQKLELFKKFKFKFSAIRNLKISLQYALTIAVIIAFFTGSMLIVSRNIRSVDNNINMLQSRAVNTMDITALISIFNSQESYINDYIMFQDKSSIEDFEKNKVNFEKKLNTLKSKVETKNNKNIFAKIVKNNEDISNIFSDEIIYAVDRHLQADYTISKKNVAKKMNESIESLNLLQKSFRDEQETAAEKSYSKLTLTIIILFISLIVSTIISVILVTYISKDITKRLNAVVDTSTKVSQGILCIPERQDYGNNEISILSRSFQDMIISLRKIVEKIKDASQKLGNDSSHLSSLSEEGMSNSNNILEALNQVSVGVSEQTNSITQIVSSLGVLNKEALNSNTEGNNLMQDSTHMINLAKKGKEMIINSVNNIKTIDEVVKNSIKSIFELNSKLQKINEFVSLINNVAGQTRLLSLNASIEAARAGEAGRGFGVVAEEVNKLSNMVKGSASSIKEITDSIKDTYKTIVDSLQRGYEEVNNASNQIISTEGTFNEIFSQVDDVNNRAKSVTGSITKISTESNDISKNSEHLASVSEELLASIEEITANTNSQTALLESLLAEAEILDTLAKELVEAMAIFKL